MDFAMVIVPLAGIAVVGACVALAALLSRNYIKVPPNRVAIFYGRWPLCMRWSAAHHPSPGGRHARRDDQQRQPAGYRQVALPAA